jgi:hypothetical protein
VTGISIFYHNFSRLKKKGALFHQNVAKALSVKGKIPSEEINLRRKW